MSIIKERSASDRNDSAGYPEAVFDYRIACEPGQTITTYGFYDAHSDSSHCADDKLQADIAQCASDPLSLAVIGGDFNDMIWWGDPRYQNSNLKSFLRGRDDIRGGVKAYNKKLLDPIRDKLLCYISGNHEDEWLRRHAWCIAADTAWDLGAPYASYCCMVRLFFEHKDHSARRDLFVVHGSGGGAAVTQGMINAYRIIKWGRAHLIMSGHLHTKFTTEQVAIGPVGDFGRGRLQQYPVAYVQCPSYLKSFVGLRPDPLNGEGASRTEAEGIRAPYSVRKLMAPTIIGCGRAYWDIRYDASGTLQADVRTN